ncbi:hypothetical protein EGR_08807 [Echinococcus granulosus]|uniref:Uncharacterized protein n=1 Tax=Echinococcus granulosus TaxID=6210 RepID=W6UDD2_ECHGR|nr:hypothetical protein EGR_08807 [Echinococcus granulosus]EUB56332.1 hypothetical protein EGR_08807 [Echinococcus granulosus]
MAKTILFQTISWGLSGTTKDVEEMKQRMEGCLSVIKSEKLHCFKLNTNEGAGGLSAPWNPEVDKDWFGYLKFLAVILG